MTDTLTQLRDWLEGQKTLISSLICQSDTAEKAEALRVTSIAYTNALNKLDSLQSDADAALRHRLSQYSLTPKEMQVAVEIEKYRREHKVSPTFQELSDILSVSKVTIFEHVRNLKDKGVLRRKRKNGHRNRSLALAKGVK